MDRATILGYDAKQSHFLGRLSLARCFGGGGLIEYMILGTPRSGTAWFAAVMNALGDRCLHEPSRNSSFNELHNSIIKYGVSDTAAYLYDDIINAIPCRKVIIDRDYNDVRKSLQSIGLDMPIDAMVKIEHIPGKRIKFDQLFNDFDAFFDCIRYLKAWDLIYSGADLMRTYVIWDFFRHMNVQNHEAIKETVDIVHTINNEKYLSYRPH